MVVSGTTGGLSAKKIVEKTIMCVRSLNQAEKAETYNFFDSLEFKERTGSAAWLGRSLMMVEIG